ncbi:PKD domain-containing protein [Aliikangiella sp. IMCC44359]|uniref:PKD domain-containing protein n=1 Tax=Aliikangiella sp. IMCC44359 TaxID=3459125 RepID=UPI00403A8067
MNILLTNKLSRLVLSVGLLLLMPLANAQKSMEVRVESLGLNGQKLSQQHALFHIDRSALLNFTKQQKKAGATAFELQFNLNNQHQWDMVLEPNQVLTTGVADINEKDKAVDLITSITYQGYLKNKSGSKVRMTISEQLIHAVVSDGDNVYILQSNGPNKQNILSLKKGSDLVEKLKCGAAGHEHGHDSVTDELKHVFGEKNIKQVIEKTVVTSSTLTAKLVMVCDVQCLAKQSGNKDIINAEAQTMVNVINGYYSEFGVKYELQPLIFIESASNPWTDFPQDQAKHTNAFAAWASSHIAVEHNVGILLTGVEQNGTNYAFLGHMCPGDNYRYGMHDYNYSQGLQQRSNLITHELGHLWGANHITPADSKYIMNASIFDGSLAWKSTTQTVISNAVQSFSGCLDDGGPADPYCAVVTKTNAAGDDFISNLSVNNRIVNQDDIRIVPRGNYTSTIINMDKNESTNLTITPNKSFDASVIAVWIDWNQNSVLTDAGEMIGSQKGIGPYSFSITPPAGASLKRTRMRIRLAYDGDDVLGAQGELTQPCGEFNYSGGETEDYSVNVTDGNQAPEAVVANALISVDSTDKVNLDASGSTDADGDALSFAWTQTIGDSVTLSNANSAQASFIAPTVFASTELIFEVTVTDSNGAIDTEVVNVTINAANNAPTAMVASSSITVTEGNSVTLDGSSSTDVDGDVLTFVWTQTAGDSVTLSEANTAQASFTAPDVSAPTAYIFLLTITDSNGAIDTQSVTVTVNDTVTPETPPASSSGGGSLSWLLISTVIILRRLRK